MSYEHLLIECDAGIAVLWLARPEKLNALNRALWDEIPAAVTQLDADPDVRVIVLAGQGKAFCAGIDLPDHAPALTRGESISGKGESAVGKRRALHDDIRRYQRAVSSFALTNKPVIAAIHGACLGAGMDLVTACDLRFASADTVFSVRETRIGMVADVGTLQRLPRIVGDGAARELIFTGRDIDAIRAREIGLVSEVLADPSSMHARAREVAARYCGALAARAAGSKGSARFRRCDATTRPGSTTSRRGTPRSCNPTTSPRRWPLSLSVASLCSAAARRSARLRPASSRAARAAGSCRHCSSAARRGTRCASASCSRSAAACTTPSARLR